MYVVVDKRTRILRAGWISDKDFYTIFYHVGQSRFVIISFYVFYGSRSNNVGREGNICMLCDLDCSFFGWWFS